jgi:hypothetical protein
MKLIYIFFLIVSVATGQNKKINFFGTEFPVHSACEINESSARYDKNALIWLDAPSELMRTTMISMMKRKFEEKQVKEVKNQPIKVTLLKTRWEGKLSAFKKEGNDSITNFVQLYGQYKDVERLLIIIYKTTKIESFRIPTHFGFLAK